LEEKIVKAMMMIGNAHLDPVWLWQWREGYHEVKATFQSALDRLNETPDFVFTCACSCYYKWVEENDPEMFAQIKQRVAEGRWALVSGMWIQPDMNTPSGESQVRQLLYGQRYFAEKFGRIATVGYNVDSFGHNAMLPQILKRAGITDYVWMRPSVIENGSIPEGPMIWKAPDDSCVLAYRISGEYTASHRIPEKIKLIFSFADRIDKPVMCFYGVGNHGGGPTIENLNQINDYRQKRERGSEIIYATPMTYFNQLRTEKVALPTWCGELQHHASGCYSTHSRTKHLHREAENALLRMEKMDVLSFVLTGHQINKPFLRQAWENLMFNEFHDILGGCCLPEALQDAERQLGETLSIADREENAELRSCAEKH
jgi:alpha-mannosidase